MSLVINFDCDD